MVIRRIKQLFAICMVAGLVFGCASKPAEEVIDDSGMQEDTQQVRTPQREVRTPPPERPRSSIINGSLNELDSSGRYVQVGDGRFYFDFDQALVRREGHADLNKHAKYLAANSQSRVRVEGHADERGTREYNLALGERRANAIRGYLTSQGAANYQIEVISYGEEKPIQDGHNERSWAANRRVELIYR